MNNAKLIAATLVSASIFASPLRADDNAAQEEFPQKALLAASGQMPADAAIPIASGMRIGQLPQLSGGVNRDGKGNCAYSITNNFDKPVQLNFSVRQYNQNLEKISSSASSFRLKPAETQSSQIRESSKTTGCAVVLESWKFR